MCPFFKKPCEKVKDCHLRRTGLRYFTDGRKPEPFKRCTFHIIADCLENQVERMIGQQQAMESTRNEFSKVGKFFSELTRLGKLRQLT